MLLFKIREIISPHMGEFRGYRMALAIENDAGVGGCPSFRKPFLVAESSDMSHAPTRLIQLRWLSENAGDESVKFLI